jgi:hypothetical protein
MMARFFGRCVRPSKGEGEEELVYDGMSEAQFLEGYSVLEKSQEKYCVEKGASVASVRNWYSCPLRC